MKTSPARKKFKKNFGQANHLLITSLVGLDSIESGIVSKKPENFSTSWAPRNPKRSAVRARLFVMQSFLAWAVENLEMYLTILNKKPKLIATLALERLYARAGRSIYQKTVFIGEKALVSPVVVALMEVLITWRNHTFHYNIDNQIREASFKLLEANTEEIRKNFSGMDIQRLKETWESRGVFTFKETASLINAVQKYVEEVDQYVVSNLDYERYYTEAIEEYFMETPKSKERFVSYNIERRKRFICVLLQNICGESDVEDELLEDLLKKLV